MKDIEVSPMSTKQIHHFLKLVSMSPVYFVQNAMAKEVGEWRSGMGYWSVEMCKPVEANMRLVKEFMIVDTKL